MSKKIISRKVQITQFDVLGMDIETAEPTQFVINFNGHLENNEKALKLVRNKVESEHPSLRVAAIVGVRHHNDLMGMYLDDFLAYARPMVDSRHFEEVEK